MFDIFFVMQTGSVEGLLFTYPSTWTEIPSETTYLLNHTYIVGISECELLVDLTVY